MNKQTIAKIFQLWEMANPNPTTELVYKSNFELLIAVILSAQATDLGVNKATKELFKIANTAQSILKIGEEKLQEYIKTIGLYRSKTKNIMATCKILCEQHNGIVPNNRENLEALPGVGRKTANVILNTAFGEPTIAVDTHIFRVAKRIGLSQGKTPLKIEYDLQEIIPSQYKKNAHHWLILHGRYICKARKPLCKECLIANFCQYEEKIS